jgi:hypothetical protein
MSPISRKRFTLEAMGVLPHTTTSATAGTPCWSSILGISENFILYTYILPQKSKKSMHALHISYTPLHTHTKHLYTYLTFVFKTCMVRGGFCVDGNIHKMSTYSYDNETYTSPAASATEAVEIDPTDADNAATLRYAENQRKLLQRHHNTTEARGLDEQTIWKILREHSNGGPPRKIVCAVCGKEGVQYGRRTCSIICNTVFDYVGRHPHQWIIFYCLQQRLREKYGERGEPTREDVLDMCQAVMEEVAADAT